MENTLTLNPSANEILEFVTKTQNGDYSKEKPIVTDIKFSRVDLHNENIFDSFSEETLLFGVSY